jgi:hypothetical protein
MAVIFDYILGKLRLADAGGTPATTTTPGTVVIATPVEVAAGTDPDKVVTPATLATELAKKQDSLGMSAEGDAAKYLNQQGAWTVPGSIKFNGIELLTSFDDEYNDEVGGRVALYIGEDSYYYRENHLYRSIATPLRYYHSLYVSRGENSAFPVSSSHANYPYPFTGKNEWTATYGEWASTIRFSDGYWYLHTWKWTDDTIHQDEYRAEGLETDMPWELAWESSWDGGASGVGGAPAVLSTNPYMAIIGWQDITPYGAFVPWAYS